MTYDSGHPDHRDLESRLRRERPVAPGTLVEEISGRIQRSTGRRGTTARKTLAIVFASLTLGASVVGIAAASGNGNGNGNGNSGTPAGCVEGMGKGVVNNPNC